MFSYSWFEGTTDPTRIVLANQILKTRVPKRPRTNRGSVPISTIPTVYTVEKGIRTIHFFDDDE